MKSYSLLPMLPALSVFSACGIATTQDRSARFLEKWNIANNPIRFGHYERNFQKLHLDGHTTKTAWSDTYWPSNRGGISARWNNSNPLDFIYESPTLDAVKGMRPADLAKLSPAEKYDIYVGNYTYPTVRAERLRTSKNDASWEGLCHGWAPAALHFDEPKPVLLKGANDVEIPFGSSDIKALLTYVDAEYNTTPLRWLGTRCNVDLNQHPEKKNTPACRDTNSGAFHVVIANEIGLNHNGFVADIERGKQVWNQPITGFSTQVLGERPPSEQAAPGTVKEIDIETHMNYAVENSAAWNMIDASDSTSSATYLYSVELDANGNILGGSWKSDDRPDFLWMQDAPEFVGEFSKIQEIYKASIATQNAFPEPQ